MQLEVIQQTKAVAISWGFIKEMAYEAFKNHCSGFRWTPLRKSKLLTPPGANTKLSKGSVPIYGLTLAPAGSSGYQLCPWRSPECEAACLGITAGRSRFNAVRQARINKTLYMIESPYHFFRQLYSELAAAQVKHGPAFAFRSNVLSDIPWEHIAPEIYWFSWRNYDYTKSFKRCTQLQSSPPRAFTLDLTLSHTGHNWSDCETYMRSGGKAAVVFRVRRKDPMPQEFRGFKVIDGDQSDFRMSDPSGCIVGLRAKGGIDTSSPFVLTP